MANKRNRWKLLYSKGAHFICPYCKQIFPIQEATKNFVPPISRQAELGPSKIVPACKNCNHEKGALTEKEYKRWKKEKSFFQWIQLEEKRNGKRK